MPLTSALGFHHLKFCFYKNMFVHVSVYLCLVYNRIALNKNQLIEYLNNLKQTKIYLNNDEKNLIISTSHNHKHTCMKKIRPKDFKLTFVYNCYIRCWPMSYLFSSDTKILLTCTQLFANISGQCFDIFVHMHDLLVRSCASMHIYSNIPVMILIHEHIIITYRVRSIICK